LRVLASLRGGVRGVPSGVAAIPAILGALLVAGRALAAGEANPNPLPSPRGLEFGVRLDIAHPGGAVGAGSQATTPNVSDVAATWLPIGLDAGYRLSRAVYAGGSIEWGPTLALGGGLCVSCEGGYDLQGRTEIRLYALPASTWDPWLSFGFGWEALHVAQGYGSATSSATYDGPILGNLQLGLDVRSRAIAVGPYFGVSFAEFVNRSLDPAPAGESSSIDGRVVHEWFTFGVRGSYGPW
jgi:hypothetical protein